ncbi:phage baseplate protein [Chitinasiproducens palmae]|uniref:Dit-like phage tail protein N-terminal domain-containing protein n=1 Tax=Chitinasiproducens palmae TaxID=1770053 RepID=A0A1H2PQL6_9BURK|nr:hypothetical protein [Chitinasiproducens palmae]SDV49076.1 hypothetical protein SAMN05216551_10746 [Chitinasiproducens palmae]
MGILEQIGISQSKSIGGIVFQAVLEEQHNDEIQITDHPVERGAVVSDHSYKRPCQVTIKCAWSNSSLGGISALINSFKGGSLIGSDYVSGIYSQLLALQESREPFEITTSSRRYANMLMSSLGLTKDKTSSEAIMVTLTCREILIVETKAATLPPKAAQANPAATGQIENAGTKQVTAATPADSGAVSKANW